MNQPPTDPPFDLSEPVWCIHHDEHEFHESTTTSIGRTDDGFLHLRLIRAVTPWGPAYTPSYVAMRMETGDAERLWLSTEDIASTAIQLLGYGRLAEERLSPDYEPPRDNLRRDLVRSGVGFRDELAGAGIAARADLQHGESAPRVLDTLLRTIDNILDGAM